MPRKFRRIAPVLLILLGALLGACGEDDEQPDLANDVQEVRLWLSQMPATLDPSLAFFSGELALSNQLFRGMLWYDPDLGLIPMAAESVPSETNEGISDDGLVYTFRLREGLTWSDGEPLSAADFEYGFKRVLDPRTGARQASVWFNITGAERFATASPDSGDEALDAMRNDVGIRAADTRTLVVTLNSPQPNFLHEMVFPQAMPLREDLIERYGPDWTLPEHFVGNGPFVLSEVLPDDRIVLKKNPNWWMEGPRLESVTLLLIPDPKQAFSEYLAGNLDYVGLPPDPSVFAVVDADPELRDESNTLTQLTSVALFFNNTRPPFDEKLVRQAFARAIDRAAIIDRFQPGGVQVGYSWVPAGMPGYDAKTGEDWDFNPEEAKDLLAEAGYPDGSGLPEVVFAYPESQTALAMALKEQLEQNLGVSIDLEMISINESRDRLFSGDYQIASFGWTASVPEPGSMLLDGFGCQRYVGGGCAQFPTANRAYYANPEYDRIISQATKELNSKRRLALYAQAQDLMVDDVPAVFLGTLIRRYLVKPYVKELIPVSIDQEFPGSYFLETTYIRGRDEE